MSPDRERRRFPRVKSTVAVELRYSGSTAPFRGTTSEISLSGCYVESMFTIDVGTKLDMVLWVDGQKILAKGAVATKYPQVGNGIDITEIKPEDRAKLEAFLKAQDVAAPRF